MLPLFRFMKGAIKNLLKSNFMSVHQNLLMVLFLLCGATSALSQEKSTLCDEYAASKYDNDRAVIGYVDDYNDSSVKECFKAYQIKNTGRNAFQLAVSLIETRRIKEGKAYLLKAIDDGYAAASLFMGLYIEADVFSNYPAQALAYYQNARRQGNSYAIAKIGQHYLLGINGDNDIKKPFRT